MCDFGHLHLHTEYSTLDGMIKVKDLMQMIKSHGQEFVAITDHGTTSALWEAQKYGDEYGIKVIHGCEFYFQREEGDNGHLLVLAKNNTGLKNIFKMQQIAYQEHFYKKPRITWETLTKHKEGLIITTTCLASQFNHYIINGETDKAYQWAKTAKEEFGEDFYIELQPNQIPEQFLCNTFGIEIAKKLNVEIIATNDVHYGLETDCFPHEVLLALQMNKKMSDEKRFKFSTNDFWLKSKEEMYEGFKETPREIVEIALSNTKRIADKCDSRIEKGNYLPKYYDTPIEKTERQLLVERTIQGARELELNKDKSFMKEVQNEIDIIDRNGYSGYFLIVSDYVQTARQNGIIVGDGRGSGAGSKVAYLSGITKIPPHEYDLLFARFMADGRQPDFDVDFSDQDSVFEDLQRKYGMENVARIISFGTLSPKAVIRKVMNAFDHPISLQNQISKLIPDLCESLKDAYKTSPQLLDYKKRYKTEWEVIEKLEGVKSHESQHAGGIIIYPNLREILPLKTKSDQRDKLIVAFDKYMLEELGHFKFDVLGLETLPIIQRTLNSIRDTTGVKLDLHQIDLNDPSVYNMLCDGDVSGVFQINNQAGKVIEQQPRNFRDLIAINALIRPGVGDWNEYISRRKGKEWYKDPKRPWMHETNGTMTYQEQFLLDCHHLAGWDIAYADKHVRKSKDIRNDEELKNKFLNDGLSNFFNDPSLAKTWEYLEEVWKEIENAVDGGYSFNKSHSASYAMLTYHTAYLKHYYPVHFYASMMSSENTDGKGQNEIATLMAECKNKGITISPPSINESGDTYTVAGNSINYRITTIKHVGESAVDWILNNRPFHSFGDFLERRQKSIIKQNVLVNLIKAGCFDFDNPDRSQLLWNFDMSNRSKKQVEEDAQAYIYPWNDEIKAEWELEVLGMYLTTHPMEKYGFKPLNATNDGYNCIQGGKIYDTRIFKDKNNNEMAFININTLYGNVKLIIFANTWKSDKIKTLCYIGNTILVEGRRSGNDLLVDSLEELN